jgi:hypothetical protein
MTNQNPEGTPQDVVKIHGVALTEDEQAVTDTADTLSREKYPEAFMQIGHTRTKIAIQKLREAQHRMALED